MIHADFEIGHPLAIHRSLVFPIAARGGPAISSLATVNRLRGAVLRGHRPLPASGSVALARHWSHSLPTATGHLSLPFSGFNPPALGLSFPFST
jgi:hypothetical protein